MRDALRRTTMGLVALGMGAGLGLGPTPAAAKPKPAPPEQHCVLVVVGQAADGELQTGDPHCEGTRSQALAQARTAAPLATFPIGVHYDLPGLQGSSFTVVGSSCIGGWLNLNVSWTNRVGSTWNGCPLIVHFNGYNLTSNSQTTYFPGGSLTTLNNRTNSIQYLG